MTKIILLAIAFVQFGLLQAQITRIKMGRQSDTTRGDFRLAERYQAYNWNAKGKHDHYDTTINSPKSVNMLRTVLSFMCSLWRDIRLIYDASTKERMVRLVITSIQVTTVYLRMGKQPFTIIPTNRKGVKKIIFLENQSKAAFLMVESTSGSPTIVEALIQ